MKISYFPADKAAPSYYRLRQPMAELSKRGHVIREEHNLFYAKDESDIYIFQRALYLNNLNFPYGPILIETMQELKKRGRIVVYEQDDILETISPFSSVWKRITPKDIEIFTQCIKTATFCTFSTPEIVENYKHLNSNSYVLENCIDNNLYKKKKNKDYLVVGYAGSATHKGDLLMLKGILETIANDYSNVRICLAGDPTNYEHFNIREDRLIRKETCGFKDYPKLIADFDIGLIPLEDIKFNHGKSHLKGLEYSALGIPIVASPTSAYQRFITNEVNGFLAKKSKDWFKYIRLLIEDELTRRKMGTAAKAKARSWDVKKRVIKWESLYQQYIQKNTAASAEQNHCLAR